MMTKIMCIKLHVVLIIYHMQLMSSWLKIKPGKADLSLKLFEHMFKIAPSTRELCNKLSNQQGKCAISFLPSEFCNKRSDQQGKVKLKP